MRVLVITDRRRGFVLPLALMVSAILLVFLLVSTVTTSQSVKTVGRTTELARVLETAKTALKVAASELNDALAPGGSPAGSTDWRQELLPVPSYNSRSMPSGTIDPRQPFFPHLGLKVSTVTCQVVHWFQPNAPLPTTLAQMAGYPALPQGIIQLSVEVRTDNEFFSLHRKVKQRHVFWVGFAGSLPKSATTPLSASQFQARVDIRPLATVILP